MNEQHRINCSRAGYYFVECDICGLRFNAGRGGNGAGIRWCNALRNDWWAKHTGQESPEVLHVDCEVKLCMKLKEADRH